MPLSDDFVIRMRRDTSSALGVLLPHCSSVISTRRPKKATIASMSSACEISHSRSPICITLSASAIEIVPSGTQDARYDELTVDQVADIGHRAAVERLVGEFDRNLVGELVFTAQRRQPLVLLFELHAQGVADEDHREYDAHDAERISHGVSQRDRGVFDSQRIGVSLLRGTQSGGVGHCARKDADHRRNRRARRQMNYIGRRHAQQYDRYGTHDQRHAAVLERCEKSRSDLQTDREDEQNQPEFLHEVLTSPSTVIPK